MVAVDESPAERGAPAEIAVECIVPNPRQRGRPLMNRAGRFSGFHPSAWACPACRCPEAGPGRYELIAGERRLRAAKRCGLKTVPAIIRSYTPDEAAEIASSRTCSARTWMPLKKAWPMNG